MTVPSTSVSTPDSIASFGPLFSGYALGAAFDEMFARSGDGDEQGTERIFPFDLRGSSRRPSGGRSSVVSRNGSPP
jgi:hypothetical protein